MLEAIRLGAILLVCASACGCHGSSTDVGQLPCSVDTVLQKKCQSCHASPPQFGAPMPLVTYADLTAPAVSDPSHKVYELVGTRTHDDAAPMPQPPNPRLDAADQKVLDDWIAASAPSSSAVCNAGASGGGGMSALSCAPDVHFVSPTPYAVPSDTTDEYICYGFAVTEAEKHQIIAFGPHIDNNKVVHHMLLFQADSAVDPNPTPCSFGGSEGWRIVGVWAPGNPGFELPNEAGIPLEGMSYFAVQVHYNNIMHLTGEMDASGFDVCTTTALRPNDADVIAFGTMDIDIPAHGTLDTTCDYTVPASLGDLHLVAGMPHMHALGTSMATASHAGDAGAPVDLGTRDPWDFNTQYWTPLDTVISAGDTVSTRCAWSNPGGTAVTFGENTDNEMCFSFTMYYPRITATPWKWSTPSAQSSCK